MDRFLTMIFFFYSSQTTKQTKPTDIMDRTVQKIHRQYVDMFIEEMVNRQPIMEIEVLTALWLEISHRKPAVARKIAMEKKTTQPKRPSGYILFCNEHREEFSHLPFGEVSKAMGELWKTVTVEDKASYKERAKLVSTSSSPVLTPSIEETQVEEETIPVERKKKDKVMTAEEEETIPVERKKKDEETMKKKKTVTPVVLNEKKSTPDTESVDHEEAARMVVIKPIKRPTAASSMVKKPTTKVPEDITVDREKELYLHYGSFPTESLRVKCSNIKAKPASDLREDMIRALIHKRLIMDSLDIPEPVDC